MPASRSGRRRDSVGLPKASIKMPKPAMAQAMSAPKAPVVRPKAAGKVKMPAPTIEPTTSATSAPRESFRLLVRRSSTRPGQAVALRGDSRHDMA